MANDAMIEIAILPMAIESAMIRLFLSIVDTAALEPFVDPAARTCE